MVVVEVVMRGGNGDGDVGGGHSASSNGGDGSGGGHGGFINGNNGGLNESDQDQMVYK